MIAKTLMVVSGIAFFAIGIYMWVVEMIWFNEWWGAAGILAGIFLPFLAGAFPFIYYFKEDGFGGNEIYFVAWGIGIAAAILYGLCHVWAERREAY